jgi:cell division protein FtsL
MYAGTSLVVELTTQEINRAILDLLKKIEEVAVSLDTLKAEVAKLRA